MSDEYDCDFAGDDDAMMMIRAAVRYLLQGATGGAHGDFVQRSFRSCASSRTSRNVASRIPWTMVCPAADRRIACALSTRLAGFKPELYKRLKDL